MIQDFILKPEHVTLFKHAYVDWDEAEFGAPEINPKRPYGNSDVTRDICKILGWKLHEECECDECQDLRDNAEELHRETQTALQIVLRLQTFEPGLYHNHADYGHDWRRVSLRSPCTYKVQWKRPHG